MTCIAAVTKDGIVTMGGDSAGVNPETGALGLGYPKIFRVGEYIAGVCGSSPIDLALRYADWPKCYLPMDPFTWMVTSILPAVQKTIASKGIAPDEYYEMLVGFRGRIFHFYRRQVGEEQAGFDACGSGGAVARGALFAAVNNVAPRYSVELALCAAERFNSGVRGPFTILETK